MPYRLLITGCDTCRRYRADALDVDPKNKLTEANLEKIVTAKYKCRGDHHAFKAWVESETFECVLVREHKNPPVPRSSLYEPSPLGASSISVTYKLYASWWWDDGTLRRPLELSEY